MNRTPNLGVIKMKKHDQKWRSNKLTRWLYKKKITLEGVDNIYKYEHYEQYFVSRWIKPDDVVLELGARSGVVSSCINMLLNNRRNQVSVEPDPRILSTLEKNRKLTKSHFKICTEVLGNKPMRLILAEYGVATHITSDDDQRSNIITINNITFNELKNKYKLNFTALVIDCEGCFEQLLKNYENELLKGIKLIIYEMDRTDLCDYTYVNEILKKHKFVLIDKLMFNSPNGLFAFQQVWSRN